MASSNPRKPQNGGQGGLRQMTIYLTQNIHAACEAVLNSNETTHTAEQLNFMIRGIKRNALELPLQAEGAKAALTSGQGRKEASMIQLTNLSLAMTPEYDTGVLTGIRQSMFDIMLFMRVTVLVNNRKQHVGFEDIVVEVLNFFFDDLMGPTVLVNINHLITDCSGHYGEDRSNDAAERAAVLSRESGTPNPLRQFFTQFSRAWKPSTRLALVKQISLDCELVEQYESLSEEVKVECSALKTFLKSKGYGTKRGRGNKTCLIDYITDSLGIDKTKLDHTFQETKAVIALIQCFGKGIIIVLPSNSKNKSKGWGNQRMAHICRLLKQRVPRFQLVCDILKQSVYDPIMNGTTIKMMPLKAGVSGKSMLEMMTDAITAFAATDGSGEDFDMEQ